MRLFGVLSLILWVVLAIILAVTFDWFGAREGARTALEWLLAGVEKLALIGDAILELFGVVAEQVEDVQPIEMPK